MSNAKSNQVTRRSMLQSIGAAAIVSAAPQAARAQTSSRPNVLLIHVHDLGRYLHCYGRKTVQSPRLDQFASEGVRFANMFCTAPQCSPSRASLFTGRYPHNTGMMGLAHALFAWDLNPDEVHLGQHLLNNGYRTAGIGVIHETHSGPQRCGLESHEGPSRAVQAADAAIKFIDAYADENPFYLQVGFIEPHRMAREKNVDQGFLGKDLEPDTTLGVDVPQYLQDTEGTRQEVAELQGAVHHVDMQVGRILDALRDSGREADTLAIFTTDHGVALPRSKCAVYDPGLEVTFILRYPGREGWYGGRVIEDMMSNIDIVPSLLDVVGIEKPNNLHGRSFAPLLDGGSYEPREEIFGEITYHDYYDPRRCIRTHTHKLIANFSNSYSFMDPSQSWRPRSDTVVPPNHAVSYHEPLELYDLVNDPWERDNLAANPDHAATRNALIQRLLTHLEATEDPILQGAVTSPMHRRTVAALRGEA